jgi:MFS transporter, CP family, cyanate transporter
MGGHPAVVSSAAAADQDERSAWFPLGLAIVLVALNLRPAMSSVGPVLAEVRAELGLSATAAGMLTVLPLLCFGFASLLAPGLARRFGVHATIGAALAATVGGLVLRVGPSPAALFGGTLVIGASVAIVNVLLPALVKRAFSRHTGLMMGLYVSVMSASAATAAGITVPLAEATRHGWRGGLGVWALPAALALLFWLGMGAGALREQPVNHRTRAVVVPLIRDRLAWHVTIYFGLQSLGFYSVLAWLPSVYRSHGVDPATAGVLLSIVVILGVPISLVAPSLLARAPDQRRGVTLTAVATGAGLFGLLVAPTTGTYLWAVLLGIGMGVAFPLALTLVVLRARDAVDAGRLSAMSQSAGYLLAATGPFLFGVLHDVSGGWHMPVALLLLLLAVQTSAGLRAARPLHVGVARAEK